MQNKQQKSNQNKSEGFNVQAITKYLAYWPMFIVFLIFSLACAFLYLHYAIPMYEANATLIIKDEKKGSDDSRMIGELDAINGKKIIENEVEVLQSRSLMNTVVLKLHLYAPIFQEGKIKSISAYEISPLIIQSINPDSLQLNKKIEFQYDAKRGTVLLDKSYRGAINNWINTPYGTLKFIKNENYIPSPQTKPYFFALVPPKLAVEGILNGLKVAPANKLSSVIDLSYRDEIPKRAEDILNELLTSYYNAAMEEKNTLARNTLVFIGERLNFVRKDLDSIETKIKQYKTGSGAVDISRQGQIYLDNASNNDKRLSDINTQITVMETLERNATGNGGLGVLPSSLGINDPSLNAQMTTLSGLQLKYEQLKGTVGENNPLLQQVASQIEQVKPAIVSNIQGLKKSLEQSRNNLNASGGTFTNMISSIPEKEQQLLEITRDQNIKQTIYSYLLQKREESELSLASSISDSKVVNYAQASIIPVSPKRMIIYILAVAIALGLPVALITARETLSPKILYRHEIESLTDIPIVGEVSFDKSKDKLAVQAGKRSVIAEEFRKVRVSLLSLGIDATHKKLLITSSISGEGKSFIAANLATSISLTRKKTILVDIDLHNPGLGKFFDIKQSPGISDYLTGEKKLEQIIFNIPGNENLFYISSGNLQSDSSELLENGRIQKLIAQLDADFDFIVLDAAPVVLITDAYLLSSLCDATLYVIMHKFTPKVLVKRIDDSMATNPIKNPGIVFNGVRTRGFLGNNSSGYGYNYVYSYDNKKKKRLLT